MSKRWWDDEHYKAILMERVNSGTWYVVADNLPGKVINIVYAGYKLQLPDESTVIVSPDKLGDNLRDATIDEYLQSVECWKEAKVVKEREIEEVRQAQAAIAARQAACLHAETETYISCAAAGCDIYDTYCKACEKVLRRSWATAYDRDPDDHIADWDWLVREVARLYNQTPNQENYRVVDSIGSDLPAHHCRPKPT